MAHVFISYAHEDGDFGDVLINKLKEEGITHWVDSEHLRAGEDWRQTIDDAIRNSFALIVIMSPAAKASEYVTYEWAFAVGAGIQVIPLLYKTTPLHPRLEALQHLNFTNRNARPWEKLFEALNLSKKSYVPPHQPAPQVDIATARLIEDLSSINVHKRRKAIKALSNIGDRSAVPDLIKVLQTDSSPSARMETIDAIVKIGDISASRSLIAALHSDASIIVRSAAAWALGEFRSREAVESLLQVMEDWDRGQEQTKIAAIEALKKIGDKSVVPRLIKAMRPHFEEDVAAKVIQLVVYFYQATAIKQLVLYLDDKAPSYFKERILQMTVELLERIGSREALAAVEEWRKQQGNEPSAGG